mgnify:CR=1 FL=1
MGHNGFSAPEITKSARATLSASGAATGLDRAPSDDLAPVADAGGSLFVIGSDHGAIRAAGADGRTKIDRLGT